MTMQQRNAVRAPNKHRTGLAVLAVAAVLAISACATPPDHDAPPAPAPRPPLPSPHVVFAPAKGQSPAQQERDRYECFQWAITKTGFDPSRPRNPPVGAYEEDRLASRIQHFRRAMTACLTGRNYRVD